MTDPARNLQRNAADPQQVKRAGRKVQSQRDRLLGSMREVMRSPAGRVLVWGLLGYRPIDETVYDHSGSSMYYKEGQRSMTLWIKATALEADEDLYLLMEKEMRAYQRGQALENAAMNTRAVGEGDSDV